MLTTDSVAVSAERCCHSLGIQTSQTTLPAPAGICCNVHAQMLGGGNCGNALTGTSRLGLQTALITKIGDDGIGDTLIQVHDNGHK